MVVRTQITLDDDTHRKAKRRAAELGLSLAKYIRQLVSRDLGQAKHKANVSAVFDLGRSEAQSDVARDKDAMLAEAVKKE